MENKSAEVQRYSGGYGLRFAVTEVLPATHAGVVLVLGNSTGLKKERFSLLVQTFHYLLFSLPLWQASAEQG